MSPESGQQAVSALAVMIQEWWSDEIRAVAPALLMDRISMRALRRLSGEPVIEGVGVRL